MISIEFSNSQEKTIFIQVDPWACLYQINKDESIEFAVEFTSEEKSFCIDEYNADNRILTLWNCDEFFVIQNGKRIHWEEYPSNL